MRDAFRWHKHASTCSLGGSVEGTYRFISIKLVPGYVLMYFSVICRYTDLTDSAYHYVLISLLITHGAYTTHIDRIRTRLLCKWCITTKVLWYDGKIVLKSFERC